MKGPLVVQDLFGDSGRTGQARLDHRARINIGTKMWRLWHRPRPALGNSRASASPTRI